MKRFRWWILALLLLGGAVLALVSRPEPEPLKLTLIGRTNDASGQQYVIVEVSNRSRHEFWIVARSEALVGNEWRPVELNRPESAILEVRDVRLINPVMAGGTRTEELQVPTEQVKWRVKIDGVREMSRLEKFVEWLFGKLQLEHPIDFAVEISLEFNE
jgi:hypothetical protein